MLEIRWKSDKKLSRIRSLNPLDITADFQGHPSRIWLGACRFQDQSGGEFAHFPEFLKLVTCEITLVDSFTYYRMTAGFTRPIASLAKPVTPQNPRDSLLPCHVRLWPRAGKFPSW